MTTYICGYWKVDNNAKRSFKHYNNLIPKTLDILQDCNVIFYYNDDDILEYIQKYVKTKNIIYKKIPIEELDTYELSEDYLDTCKEQNNNVLRKINVINEKGLVHYKREYKKSGEDAFRKIFTIWTSKLYLVSKIIEENPFNTNDFAWIDASSSRFDRKKKVYIKKYSNGKIYHPHNNMRYFGKILPINASFLVSDKETWEKIMPIYINKLELYKNSKYSHDEETILYLVWEENKELFCDLRNAV